MLHIGSSPLAGTALFRNLAPDKQEKVFHAAVDEFASHGYRNASMNAVVKAAGISKGSLFLYFKTKGDLFNLVVDIATTRAKQHLESFRARTADQEFFQRLEGLIREGFRFIDRHPLLARIYFHLLQSGEAPCGEERVLQLRKQADGFVAGLIREAMARDEVSAGLDVPRVAFLMNAVLEKLLQAYYTEFLASGLGLYQGDPQELEQWVKIASDLFRRGIA